METTTNDISTIFSNYVKKALLDAGRGMKSLLVDEDTLAIVNNAMNQTDVLKRDVFAVEPLRNRNTNRLLLGKEEEVPSSSLRREEDNLRFVKAVCILRPTSENVNALCERIRESGDASSSSSSSYGEFHVFFTNAIDEHKLRAIAKADARGGREDQVKQI